MREIVRRRLEALASPGRRTIPVSFAIVGAHKAATSTLYRMLIQHREVAGGHEKEMRFFSHDEQDWESPDYSTYARPARRPSERVAGDASPAYLSWTPALHRMRRYDADMRLVAVFRDPVERAVSHWAMERSLRPHYPDLPEALRRSLHVEIPDAIPGGATLTRVLSRALMSRGRYGGQLERGLEIFPREQWLLLEFRDFLARPAATLERVAEHVGIHRFRRPPALVHTNAGVRGPGAGPVPVDDVRRLVEAYATDLPLFARLSGLDVSRWPTSRVLAGELAVEDLSEQLSRRLAAAAPTPPADR